MADHKLTIKGIEKAVREKDVGKHADGGGLYLQITEAGGAYWRYKYRLAGREKLLALGTLADISLAAARDKHAAARLLVLEGDDPVDVKHKVKAAKVAERNANRPFPEVVQEWFDKLILPVYTAKNTLRRYQYNANVLKAGIKVGIGDVRKAHLTEVLLPFQDAGKHETRRRIQVDALAIMEMAHDRDYVQVNHLAGATFKSYTAAGAFHKLRPAITDAAGFGRLLGDIDRMNDRAACALRLLALTMLRPGELLQCEWKFIDWKNAKLVVPFRLLKMRTKRKGSDAEGRNLEVPLSRQTVAELRTLQKRTGNHKHLFPALAKSESKVEYMRGYRLNRALDRAEYKGSHCPHGFRSSASTMLNAERRVIGGEEVLRWPEQRALIELQLDHNDASVQAIYDRGGRWKERCELMQLWADRIDEMRGSRVAHLRLAA